MTDDQATDLWPIDATERAGIERTAALLESIDNAIAGWTSKVNARTTGVSIYITFERKTDVMTALEFASVLEQCPGMLAGACLRLLAAIDAEGGAS